MKSIRLLSRVALLAGIGFAQLIACSSDTRHSSTENAATGTLQLPLEARARSGNLYRLRNAFFQITNSGSGQSVFVSSEDDLRKAVITTVLTTGDYTITLQPGWFMERVSGGGGGTGGTPGFGGAGGFSGNPGFGGGIIGGFTGVGGFFDSGGEIGVAGKFTKALPFPPDEPVGGAGGEAPIAGTAGEPEGGDVGFGGFPTSGGKPSFGGFTSSGGITSTGGITGEGGGVGSFVDAHLLSNAVQFFSIFSRGDSFVTYSFQIGGEVLNFDQGRLNIGIDVTEAEPQCDTPPNVTRPERVLLENDTSALKGVSLRTVFDAIANNGGRKGDGLRIYQEIFDSYATADRALLPDAVHCGDEVTDGVPTLNGYPIDCNRIEAQHVNDIDSFFLTAIVNRIDFMPANGANCGQQRMVFANPSRGRTFMIIEAVVPNPQPDLGVKGCLPLAQFWMDQNSIDDPFARGQRLVNAFINGDPSLLMQGFGPFYTAENLTAGTGQIRTNQFDQGPWTLREFRLALDGDQVKAIPFPTAEAPNGGLWDENSGLPQGEECRQNFLSAMEGLLTDDMNKMSFVVDAKCRDAESRNDGGQAYQFRLSNGFRQTLNGQLLGTGLSADDIAARAQFAGSCIGCHNEASGGFLGRGVVAPISFDFPQVLESTTSDCGSSRNTTCFQTSNALKTVFLPGRLNILSNLLGVPVVTDPCNNGTGGGSGTGGFGGVTGFGGAAGSFGSAGAPPAGGRGGSMGPAPGGKPSAAANLHIEGGAAPKVVVQLPSANLPLSDLVRLDSAIRAKSGKLTIGGRSAQSSH